MNSVGCVQRQRAKQSLGGACEVAKDFLDAVQIAESLVGVTARA
jgi:hypothetical protein